jgi:hypothetical protein
MPESEILDVIDMSPLELKTALKKLKNKEARLEADLAIKEHPELEEAITPIVLALNKFNDWNKKLSSVADPTWSKELKSIEKQLVFYKKRVKDLERNRNSLLSISELPTLREGRDLAAKELREMLTSYRSNFSSAGISPDDIIPSLEDFV